MYNGYDAIRWVVYGTVTIVIMIVLPTVLMDLAASIGDSMPDSGPTGPAKPVDWNPLIITGAVILATAFLAVIVVFGMKIAGRKRKVAQREAALIEANTRAWNDVFARHDAIKDHYYKYAVEDLDLILRFPALQDTSEPFVEEFLQKFYTANDCRPGAIDGAKDPAGTDYLTAVGSLERAWEQTLSTAARIASSKLSQDDRKRLKMARKHWAVVNDEAATSAERSLHARQLQKCLDGLINLEDKPQTATALESAIRPALESQASPVSLAEEGPGVGTNAARPFDTRKRAARVGK